ncbi:hypothetical protein PORCAN_2145 [Porphyromonas crevioricanis JCM 13913]|nr:hypothetical protein PORCAN_2145 [Porphyromonas crevioricanis JCM 13913]
MQQFHCNVSVKMLPLHSDQSVHNSMQRTSSLYGAAATYGLIFGAFWVIKYVFFMSAFRSPLLGLLYLPLTSLDPVVAYYLTRRYRNSLPERAFSFGQGWRFGVLLYFFAAILVSIPHYYFYHSILPQHLPLFMEQMEEVLRPMMDSSVWEEMQRNLTSTSPIKRVINDIWSNCIWGILLSLPVAAILRRN